MRLPLELTELYLQKNKFSLITGCHTYLGRQKVAVCSAFFVSRKDSQFYDQVRISKGGLSYS